MEIRFTPKSGRAQHRRRGIAPQVASEAFPAEIQRVTRLRAALADLDRCGSPLLRFVDGLTDGEAIKQAEAAEAVALRASKVA